MNPRSTVSRQIPVSGAFKIIGDPNFKVLTVLWQEGNLILWTLEDQSVEPQEIKLFHAIGEQEVPAKPLEHLGTFKVAFRTVHHLFKIKEPKPLIPFDDEDEDLGPERWR